MPNRTDTVLITGASTGIGFAAAILHLAHANFTTGAIYPLDGGHTAGHHFA